MGMTAFSPSLRKGLKPASCRTFPQEEADIVYATQGPLAARCFDDKITTAAWQNKPSWYIVAEKDHMIPPAVQRDAAARMKATTVALPSSHVPMLSQPQKVASVIASAIAKLA
jgi:pimeloyl-ACP methyl ester carboxylesterase